MGHFCTFGRTKTRFIDMFRKLARALMAVTDLFNFAAMRSMDVFTRLAVRSPQRRIYFGRIIGSPPGLPGGGITGILPVSGVGARISGSIPVGGQSTPSDLASLSPSGSARGSVAVVPCGAMVPCCGIDCVGAQPVAFLAGAGGAV